MSLESRKEENKQKIFEDAMVKIYYIWWVDIEITKKNKMWIIVELAVGYMDV